MDSKADSVVRNSTDFDDLLVRHELHEAAVVRVG
jgi:hypothetical protein